MSTKIFNFDGGIAAAMAGICYTDGGGINPVEWQLVANTRLQIHGWHNVADKDRAKLIADLAKAGWVEGEQIK